MSLQGRNSLDNLFKTAKKILHGKKSVLVGFTANHGLFVHENMQASHNVGQAKFLEQPLRQRNKKLKRMISNGIRRGLSVEKALLLAGLFLQREAQKLTPVDTGNLRGSAFTQLD